MYTYPRPESLAYPAGVLADEGALSRGDPSTGELAGPGRPGPVDRVAGGALGGAAPSLGRARCLAARGGYVNPASRVPIGALAPPTAPSPRAVREGLANLGRFAPREYRGLAV